jgi:hypothetical protein
MFVRALLIVLLTAVASCRAADAVIPLPVGDLQAAPASITVGGQTLVLVPYLWRDFQPISPPDGKPLIAVLRIQDANRSPLATSIHADVAWIVNGGDVWAVRPREEQGATTSSLFYEAVARDGPKWGPGVAVDVVVRLREPSGATHLLRASGLQILRTD